MNDKKLSWKTQKSKASDFTMIEVYDGTNSLCMYVSPKTVTKMTTKEMEQLIRRLGQAMELYND